jgi:hypothetical protein
MGVYDAITDPTNRFDVSGISDEDRALLSYLVAAKAATGIDVVVTCTTDHPAGATRHLQDGTAGRGLAVDCRLRQRGNDIHRSVFELFVPIQRQLYELIYADPPSDGRTDGRFGPYNIKAGKRVAPYAVASHHDHVHVAVNRGTFVRFPISPSPPVPPPPTGPAVRPGPTYEDDTMQPHFVSLHAGGARLDGKGNGYWDLPQFPYDTVVTVNPNVANPPEVGGYNVPDVAWLRWAPGIRVVVEEGVAGGGLDVVVWTAG